MEDETDIRYRLDVIGRLFKVRAAVKQCRDNIKTLKQNSTLIQKQVQLEALIKIRAELEIKAGKYQKDLGRIQEKIEGKDREIQEQRDLKAKRSAELAEIVADAGKEYSSGRQNMRSRQRRSPMCSSGIILRGGRRQI